MRISLAAEDVVPGQQDRRARGALSHLRPTQRRRLCRLLRRLLLRRRRARRPLHRLPLLPRQMRHRAQDAQVRLRAQVVAPGAAADLVM